MPKGRVHGPDVIAAIALYAREGMRAPEIRDELARDTLFSKRMPQLRTIQRTASDFKLTDDHELWRFSDQRFSPNEARCAAACLAAVVRATGGRRNFLTLAEAQLVARIMAAVPEIEEYEAFVLAGEYAVREAEGRDTAGLDQYIAFRSYYADWETGWRTQYQYALEHGHVSDPPVWWHLEGTNLAHKRMVLAARDQDHVELTEPGRVGIIEETE